VCRCVLSPVALKGVQNMADSKLNRKYGWKPDPPDERDFVYKCVRSYPPKGMPSKVNLNRVSPFPPIYDQGSLGSCTGQAIAAAIAYANMKTEAVELNPSRLFIYYNERELEDTINEDSGAAIRDGIKVVNKFGVCTETLWPYDIQQFAARPPEVCYQEAIKEKVVEYARVQQAEVQLKRCLAELFPVVFGLMIYSSFESPDVVRTGIVNFPTATESLLGGHAVLLVGYDDFTKRFLVRNSWGAEWGQGGHFTIPYSYVSNPNLAADFWTIRLVGGPVMSFAPTFTRASEILTDPEVIAPVEIPPDVDVEIAEVESAVAEADTSIGLYLATEETEE
jgi:C1A family cysteine protease